MAMGCYKFLMKEIWGHKKLNKMFILIYYLPVNLLH